MILTVSRRRRRAGSLSQYASRVKRVKNCQTLATASSHVHPNLMELRYVEDLILFFRELIQLANVEQTFIHCAIASIIEIVESFYITMPKGKVAFLLTHSSFSKE